MGPLQFIADYIEKARSYVYGIYAFWLCLFTLPIIFTALFVDQNLIYKKTNLLKGEYILNQFFSFNDVSSYIYPITILVAPLIMTWLVIWIFPKKLVKSAYKEELDNQYEREFMKLGKDDELNMRRTKTVQETVKIVEDEKKINQEKEEFESREIATWRREYNAFRSERLFSKFQQIIAAVYEKNGSIKITDGYGETIFQIDANVLAMAHSKGLVDIDNSDEGIVKFTPKGLYFVGRYTSDSNG